MLCFQLEVLASSFLYLKLSSCVERGMGEVTLIFTMIFSCQIAFTGDRTFHLLLLFCHFPTNQMAPCVCISLVSEHCPWMKLYEENFESLWETPRKQGKSLMTSASLKLGVLGVCFVPLPCVVTSGYFRSPFNYSSCSDNVSAQAVLMELLWPCNPENTLSISCPMPWLKLTIAWGLVLLFYRPHSPRRMLQVEW